VTERRIAIWIVSTSGGAAVAFGVLSFGVPGPVALAG
jgi:hypothetical protein